MGLDKTSIKEIMTIAEMVTANHLVGSKLAKDSKENSDYHQHIRPAVDVYYAKFGLTPEKNLEEALARYLKAKDLTEKYEARGYRFFGQTVNPYVWAAITLRTSKKMEYKSSFFPQLYILVGDHGLKIGFSYGSYVEKVDGMVRSVKKDPTLQNLIYRSLQGDGLLGYYSYVNAAKPPDPTKQIAIEMTEDVARNWTEDVQILAYYRGDRIPTDVDKEIEERMDMLLPFFDKLSDIAGQPEVGSVQEPPKYKPSPPRVTKRERYTIEDFQKETGHDVGTIEGWIRQIRRKRHVILQGPPGTGKTFIAERLAKHLISETDGFCEVIQFHPAYAYEDFIQGIRPKIVSNGVSYELEDGKFLDFCKRASKVTNGDSCVLIIDELNRANLPRVFGELMYLLEYRGREIRLAVGDVPFSIPPNIYIIGTMNTADRSIALVDTALRRRFSTIRLSPEYSILKKRLDQVMLPSDSLIQVLTEINVAIDDRNYSVGISYFMCECGQLKELLPDIWQTEIEPYLEDRFFDQPSKVEDFRWAKLKDGKLKDWA